MRLILATCLLALAASGALAAAEKASAIPLRDGDRVVLLGNTFIERENNHGHIELALTASLPSKQITFRNLGWSGDTVRGQARAYFGTPEDGYKHLLQYVDMLDPTVLIISYGTNESFAGPPGIDAFVEQYEKLLSDLEGHTQRIVLLSPTPMENLGPPLPDPAEANQNLALYTRAIADLAKKRGHTFINLFEAMAPLVADPATNLTNNGLHLTANGYAVAGRLIAAALVPDAPTFSPQSHEDLRRLIIEKNELFFHRYRPQNETYLRGFRKHEQGNNAVEIEQFEPLIAEKDNQIAKLRQQMNKDRSK